MIELRTSLSSSPFFFFFLIHKWMNKDSNKTQKLRAFAQSKQTKADRSFLLFLFIHIYPYLFVLSVSPVCSYLFHSHLHHYGYHGYCRFHPRSGWCDNWRQINVDINILKRRFYFIITNCITILKTDLYLPNTSTSISVSSRPKYYYDDGQINRYPMRTITEQIGN